MILKPYFSNKKNLLLFTTFFTIAILFIMIIIAYKTHISFKLNVEINNKIENKTLLIGKDECDKYDCIERNLNNNSIGSIYNYIFDFYGNSLELGSSLFKEGILEMIPEIIEGEPLDKESENSIIIPKYIKVNGKIIDTSSYLYNNIDFKINHYNVEMKYNPKVIGIYNNENNIDDKIVIYYSYKDISLFNNANSSQLLVILKDESDIPSFIEYLDDNNFYYNYFNNSKLKELNSYKNLYRLVNLYEVIIILIVISIIIIFVIIIVNDQKYNIALKKAIGYTNATIEKILIKELIYYFTFIYLFLMILIGIFINIFDLNILFSSISKYILLYLLVIISILMVNIITFKKISKIEIINLLRQ